MLVVESVPVRRHWFEPAGAREDQAGVFQDKKPIKQICRELRVSRKTVRKVIRSGVTEFSYERSVQPQPKVGPWRDELDRMLAENARQPKRERLTHIRIFEELRALGYDGGYRAPVCGRLVEGGERSLGGSLRAAELRSRRGVQIRLRRIR